MTAVRENGATLLASYGYDDLGRRTSLTRGNGTVTTYAFDPASRLASLSHDVAGTGQDVIASFTHLPSGQIASVTRSNDSYAWNGAVNVDRDYSVNGLNQLTQSGGTALGYDARGNLTSSGSTSYAYSAENLLTSASGTPSGSLSFFYDGVGRLAVKYTPTDATAFLYDGNQIATEHDKLTLAVQRRYVYGADADEPLVWYEGSGTGDKRYLHADERGSVIAVSNASGTVTDINTYDEYGIPAATNVGRFQYTGQAWLPELGMYYYKARIYSPTLGRFLQTDPIGYGDGLNWYNYVGGDPVNARDPSGLETVVTSCHEGFILLNGHCVDSDTVAALFQQKQVVGGGGGGGGGGGAPGASPPAPPKPPAPPRRRSIPKTPTAPKPKPKTDLVCGVFQGGSIGCKRVPIDELCKQAGTRLAVLGILTRSSAIEGNRIARALITAEIIADTVDTFTYCQ